jgi:protein FAM32A
MSSGGADATGAAYRNVVGGKLRLKGAPAKPTIAKKAATPGATVITDAKKLEELIVMPETTRTAAELAYERKLLERENLRVSKMAAKSHKERVEEFNKYLAGLSEHHDIPKVDPRNQ